MNDIPIFSQDWWLDIVSINGDWDVVLAEKGGEIVGSMPYYVTKNNLGFKAVVMPPLTQSMGPWLKYPEGQKYTTRLGYEKKIMTELINKLPSFDYFSQNFNYSVTNWLPFYWKGFNQTTKYTYLLEDLNDLEAVFKNFRENVKTDIRKAEKTVKVLSDDNIESTYAIIKKTFDRRKIRTPFSPELLTALDKKCAQHADRKIYVAEDEQGGKHAAIYLVCDARSVYYLLGGGDPDLRKSGATSLLLWEAIRFAASRGLKFDFEGSMEETIERFFRAFGATQKPYFKITKCKRPFLTGFYLQARSKLRSTLRKWKI